MSEKQDHVPGAVVRISEIVGSSPNSFSDAVRNAVQAAAQTVRGIRGVEVIGSNADVDENGNLSLYKVHCKIAFVVERSIPPSATDRAEPSAGARRRHEAAGRASRPAAHGASPSGTSRTCPLIM